MSRRNNTKPGQVRIIGGKWRGRKLKVASESIRPTPDRARVTAFNWLAERLPDARVLDLFAGTGVLGFEALSRGAAHATFVDSDARAVAYLARHRDMLGPALATIEKADAVRWLAAQPAEKRWDVVFLDPPFGSPLLRWAIGAVAARVSANGVVYAESDAAFDWHTVEVPGIEIIRRSTAGAAHYVLIRHRTSPHGSVAPGAIS